LANQLGFDFSEHDNEKLKGVSRMESLEIMLNVGKVSLSMEQKVFYAEMKNQWYREFILAMQPDEVLPGAIDLFKALRTKGIKIALGSASKNAQTILDRTNLSAYFDVVIDGNKTQKLTPNHEVF
jgi:beta-phosphoglucomutase